MHGVAALHRMSVSQGIADIGFGDLNNKIVLQLYTVTVVKKLCCRLIKLKHESLNHHNSAHTSVS